jgi:hypothetical protein
VKRPPATQRPTGDRAIQARRPREWPVVLLAVVAPFAVLLLVGLFLHVIGGVGR